jgi:hypothetical protein
MGIYVGCSPSHAFNVLLILNPRTSNVLPQFYVVYYDDFTTVPYLRKATVPPHWAALVSTSSNIAQYTKCKVGTWQSFPDLDIKLSDFTSENANIDTAPSTTLHQHHEGNGHSEGANNSVTKNE